MESFGGLETLGVVLIVVMLLLGVWRYYTQKSETQGD
jgi:uncharacterized membrane protein